MEELIRKLKDTGKLETIKTGKELGAAAKELGYSDEDFKKMLTEIPLADDVLDQVAGGSDPNQTFDYDDGPWTLEEILRDIISRYA